MGFVLLPRPAPGKLAVRTTSYVQAIRGRGRRGPLFRDRIDAGRQLADAVRDHDVEVDLVLGIPRGGLPVAHPVAGALGVALDVIVASKIGAPNDTEFAIGAVASDGSLWRDEDLIDRTGADEAYAERAHESEAREARENLNAIGSRPSHRT